MSMIALDAEGIAPMSSHIFVDRVTQAPPMVWQRQNFVGMGIRVHQPLDESTVDQVGVVLFIGEKSNHTFTKSLGINCKNAPCPSPPIVISSLTVSNSPRTDRPRVEAVVNCWLAKKEIWVAFGFHLHDINAAPLGIPESRAVDADGFECLWF